MKIETFFKCWAAVLIGAIIYAVFFADAAQAADTVTAPVTTLQDSLVAIIQQVQSGVSAGVSFLSQEIPDVIRQLLLWKLIESASMAGILLISFLTGLILFIKGVNYIVQFVKYDTIYYNNTGDVEAQARLSRDEVQPRAIIYGILGTVGVILCVATFVNSIPHIMTAIQIYVAPKVWLIEYAASLVK